MSDTPFLVETVTDSMGTYETRWMVPPPGDGVTFRVTADVWIAEYDDTGERGTPSVRLIHEWKPVES